MRLNGRDQISGTTIVQEENALAGSPQWRRTELVAASAALPDVVGQARAHVMDFQVREQVGVGVAQAGRQSGGLCSERRRVTNGTADGAEQSTPPSNGG